MLVAAISFTACSGGGTPGVVPTTAPTLAPVAYNAQLLFGGTLAGSRSTKSIDGHRHNSMIAPLTAGATPVPIMIVNPATVSGVFSNTSGYGGLAYAVVSPGPSSSPSAVVTDGSAYASAAPTANPSSAPSGTVATYVVTSNNTGVGQQSASTVSVALGSPVNQTPTTAVYSYMSIALGCVGDPGTSPAYKWDGTTWQPQASSVGADIYLTGSKCTDAGFIDPTETYGTLHFPGGGSMLSTAVAYCDITAASWVNTQTTADLGVAITSNPDGSENGTVLAKTADGLHTFKFFPNDLGSYPGNDYGAIEVAGSSIDGF